MDSVSDNTRVVLGKIKRGLVFLSGMKDRKNVNEHRYGDSRPITLSSLNEVKIGPGILGGF